MTRNKHGNDKYNVKYAKQLEQGLCKDGSSIKKVCRLWGISLQTYNGWIERYPRFAIAAETAKLDRAIWWEDLAQAGASGKQKVNAGIICFAMKNIEGINWADKVEVHNTHEEQLKVIEIVLAAPPQIKAINYVEETNIIDAESD